MTDPICGNCGKPLSAHFHEDDDYCNDKTNETFTSCPSDYELLSWMRHVKPEQYDALVKEWLVANGH